MPNLRRSLCPFVFAAAAASAPIVARAIGDEEFVGPFVNWANVKTDYGAAGGGVTDDTAAIQNALNSLGFCEADSLFPGRGLDRRGSRHDDYYLGRHLRRHGNVWSRFDRLTFNGQSTAAVDVDQSWMARPAISTPAMSTPTVCSRMLTPAFDVAI
jgi:hypothetical protein